MILIYDDYNSSVRKEQDIIGTITCNIGGTAPRNGFKLVEIYDAAMQDKYKNFINPQVKPTRLVGRIKLF